ncbi:MAG: hypothetical protein ACOYN0_13000 [Phycisphaerales bacterium]
MRHTVLVSGCWNIALCFFVFTACQVLTPESRELLGIRNPGIFWTLILCGVLLVTGAVLVLASRDLVSRGSIVYYEGLARLCAAALLFSRGVAELGSLAIVIAVPDLCFGLLQVIALPAAIGRTPRQLLLDTRDARRTS